jgi:hypothetical protein
MSRRLPAAFALVAVAAISLTACSGTPSAPALTTPDDIIAAALKSTESAKSFHADATVDGNLSGDLMGSGTSQSFNLAGTTASADVDLVNKAVHASFAVPALLGVSGDLIVVDQKAYVKTSLTGPKYMVSDVKETAGVDPTDTGKTIDNVGDLLTQPGIEPVKGEDVACGSKQCYTVNVDLTADEMTKIAGAQASSLPVKTDGSLKVQIRVEKDTNHLAGLTAEVASPTQGSLKVDIVISKWDEPVTISAPPADQVQAS